MKSVMSNSLSNKLSKRMYTGKAIKPNYVARGWNSIPLPVRAIMVVGYAYVVWVLVWAL